MGVKRSKIVMPLHLVWTTKNREGWISAEIEERLYRILFAKAEELKAKVLAIGAMPDHIHIAVLLPSTITVAALVKQLKGASQNLASEALLGRTVFWQEGYGAFAFQINARHRVNCTRRVPGAERNERSPKREQLVASNTNHCLEHKPTRILPPRQRIIPHAKHNPTVFIRGSDRRRSGSRVRTEARDSQTDRTRQRACRYSQ